MKEERGPSAGAPASSADGSRMGLVPVLSLFDTTMLVMGSIIGAGVFNRPASVADAMGSFGGVLVIWGLGGVFAFTGALVFAELGGMMPRAGGQYVFVREAFGPFAAFLFGWVLLTAVSSSALAFVSGVFADHLEKLLAARGATQGLGADGKAWSAIALIVAMTLLNIRGVRLAASVQNAAMLAKIAGILLVIALGALVAAGLASAAAPPEAAAAAGWTWAGAGGALLSVLFAYGGWQNVAAVAGEVRRPERNVPVGILLGTCGVIALYVGLNAALVWILGVEGVAASRTPTADAAGAVLAGGADAVALLVLISTFAFVQGLLLLAPRIYYAMARDGVFFRSAAWIHPRWRTPVVAIAAQGFLGVLHVAFAGKDLDHLVRVCILCDLVFFASCGVALFLLRVRRPAAPRPYRALGYPWLPAVFLLLCLAMIGQQAAAARGPALLEGAVLFALGAVLYAFWRRQTAR